MSSKSKQKDRKKSKVKKDKIKLKEIAREDISPASAAESTLDKKSSQTTSAKKKSAYKVKILAAFDGQNGKKYEETAAAALNSVGGGYELFCILPSPDSQKLIAFFKLAK